MPRLHEIAAAPSPFKEDDLVVVKKDPRTVFKVDHVEGDIVFCYPRGGGFRYRIPSYELRLASAEQAKPGFHHARFSGSWEEEGASYPGITDGQVWNGWAIPWFDTETATAVVEEANRLAEGNPDNPTFEYDPETDTFTELAPDGERYPVSHMEFEGRRWHNIGDGWTWDEVDEEESNMREGRAAKILDRLVEAETPVAARRRIIDFEFVDGGIDHEQYFPGVGTAFSRFHHVATGIGDDPAEAFDDVLEMIAQQEAGDVDLSAIEQSEDGREYAAAHHPSVQDTLKSEGGGEEDEESDEPVEIHYYLSIRYNLPGESNAPV